MVDDNEREAELERDQQLYPPQHKIGDSQGIFLSLLIFYWRHNKQSNNYLCFPTDFIASKKRIDYFKTVFALKNEKVLYLPKFVPDNGINNELIHSIWTSTRSDPIAHRVKNHWPLIYSFSASITGPAKQFAVDCCMPVRQIWKSTSVFLIDRPRKSPIWFLILLGAFQMMMPLLPHLTPTRLRAVAASSSAPPTTTRPTAAPLNVTSHKQIIVINS